MKVDWFERYWVALRNDLSRRHIAALGLIASVYCLLTLEKWYHFPPFALNVIIFVAVWVGPVKTEDHKMEGSDDE